MLTAEEVIELNAEEVKQQVGYRRLRNAVHPERALDDTEYFLEKFTQHLGEKHEVSEEVMEDIYNILEAKLEAE